MQGVVEAAGEEEGVDAGGPFAVVAGEEVGFLTFGDAEGGAGGGLAEVLLNVTAGGFVGGGLEEDAVVGGEVELGAEGEVALFELVVGAEAAFGAVGGVEGVAEVAEVAELGTGLGPVAVAGILGAAADADAAVVEEAGVFLLGDAHGEGVGAGGGEEVGDQEFADAGVVIAEVELAGIAQGFVGFVEELVGGEAGVVVHDGAGGLAVAGFGHAGVAVGDGEVGAANGAVLVEQEAGAEDAAVVVEGAGVFELADGEVDLVALLVEEGGVEPGGGIVGVEFFGEAEIFVGEGIVAGVTPGFAEVAAEDGAGRFERGGDLEVLATVVAATFADAAETATEPSVAESGVEGDGAVEPRLGVAGVIAGAEEEAFEGECLGVARREGETFFEGGEGLAGAAETEFEFGDADPGEAEGGRNLGGLAGVGKGFGKALAGLGDVGFGEPFAGEDRFGRGIGGAVLDGGDDAAEGLGGGIGAGERVEGGLGAFDLADGEEQRRVEYAGGVGGRSGVGGEAVERLEEVAGRVGAEGIGKGGLLGGGKADFLGVDHAGVVEAPLHEVTGFDAGGFGGSLAGGDFGNFAGGEGEGAVRVVEIDGAVDEGEEGLTGVGDLKEEFGATDGPGSSGGVEVDVEGFLAAEEVERAALDVDHRALGFGLGRAELEGGHFVDPEDAEIGEAEGGAAVGAGTETVSGAEDGVGLGGFPFGCAAAAEFDPALGGKENGGVLVGDVQGKRLRLSADG